MVFEGFEPIFGEPNVEWASRGPLPLRRFVYYLHSPDPSHLRVHASDFHTNTWEAVLSVHQLEDMLDYQNILTDLKQQQSLVADETNPIAEESLCFEAFKMAAGGMKKGRIYGMRLIDDEFDNMDLDGSSSSWSQKIDEMEDRIQGRMQSLDNEIRAKGGLKEHLVEIKALLQLSLSCNGISMQAPPYVPTPIAQPVGGAFDNGGGPFPGFGFSQFSHAAQQQGLRASHINDVSFTQMLLQPYTSVLHATQPNQGRARASGRTRDVTPSS